MITDETSLVPGENIRARTERRWARIGPQRPRVVVLVTSASHRRESLLECIFALGNQTWVPDAVLLRLDGPLRLETQAISDTYAGIEGLEIWADPTFGAGRRWCHPHLYSMARDTILVTLDDDLILEPEAIELTAKMVICENSAITWHGWRYEPDSSFPAGAYDQSAETDLEAVSIGAGIAAYRWRWVEHLVDHPLAAMLDAGPASDDDALLSLHLWEQGVRVQRPAGRAPMLETAQARDAGAGVTKYLHRRHGQRLALTLAFDCPMGSYFFPCPRPDTEEALRSMMRVIHELDWDLGELEMIRVNLRETIHRCLRVQRHPHIRVLEPFLHTLTHLDMITVRGVVRGPIPGWLVLYGACRDIDVCAHDPGLPPGDLDIEFIDGDVLIHRGHQPEGAT